MVLALGLAFELREVVLALGGWEGLQGWEGVRSAFARAHAVAQRAVAGWVVAG